MDWLAAKPADDATLFPAIAIDKSAPELENLVFWSGEELISKDLLASINIMKVFDSTLHIVQG